MTKIAHLKPEHEKIGAVAKRNEEKLTRVARATARARADVARESVQVAQSSADAVEGFQETTRQLTKGSPELSRALAELVEEQTRQSVNTLSTFARAVNWTDVAQAQSKLVTSSFLRISQFNARYGEFLLRGMAAVPTFARR